MTIFTHVARQSFLYYTKFCYNFHGAAKLRQKYLGTRDCAPGRTGTNRTTESLWEVEYTEADIFEVCV